MKKSVETMSDCELIKLCLDGDNYYFSELITRYKNLVYSIVLRMIKDKEEAHDLAQDVFVKIYKNLYRYDQEYKFATWIIRITTNHVIDYRRKKKRDIISYEGIVFKMTSKESPEESYLVMERNEKLNNVVDNLPDMYKIPIVLYHRQGLSYQEIADIINEPLSKVKNRIFRGRKMLKELLGGMREDENFGL